MAFWAGRGSWEKEDEGWRDSEDEQDSLFGTLISAEETDSQDEPMDDPFAMARVETDMTQLDLVERLSWDASSDEEEETPGLLLPTLLSLQVPTSTTEEQWNLISPCSDTNSPRVATLSPLTRVSISSPVTRQLRFFEPEHEPSEQNERHKVEQAIDQDNEEGEVTAFDAETCWSPATNSVLSPVRATINPFATYEATESFSRSGTDAVSESESEETQQSARPSLLPSMARWSRQKARTCSGANSAGKPTALSLSTFKARTRSLSRSRNQNNDDEDDGDFSSDDEGYTPELHLHRASETEPLGASHWRRARHTSMNLSSHRLSVSVSPAVMTKRLQDARNKLSGLHLLRSGSSASTATSEESFMGSPSFEEIKSAPAGLHREPSIFSDASTATSLISASSARNIDAGLQHPTRQQQLRAGVFKAAGFINAASAEAARKLKARGFRAPQLPRPKTSASETEEEDPENCSTPSVVPLDERQV